MVTKSSVASPTDRVTWFCVELGVVHSVPPFAEKQTAKSKNIASCVGFPFKQREIKQVIIRKWKCKTTQKANTLKGICSKGSPGFGPSEAVAALALASGLNDL